VEVVSKVSSSAKPEKRTWSYKTTIMREFGLTRAQIEKAIDEGLVRVQEVPNPHRKYGIAFLINREDVEKHLEEIKAFPKLTEEERELRKIYAERKRLRDKLETTCPICGQRVRALRDSEIFEEAFMGNVDLEAARRILLIAHVRHAHTGYERQIRRIRRLNVPYNVKLMMYEKAKRKFNRKAIKLLKKAKTDSPTAQVQGMKALEVHRLSNIKFKEKNISLKRFNGISVSGSKEKKMS